MPALTPLIGTQNSNTVFSGTSFAIPIPSWVTAGLWIKFVMTFAGAQNTADMSVNGDTTGATFSAMPPADPYDLQAFWYQADATDAANAGTGNFTIGCTSGFICAVGIAGYDSVDAVTPFLVAPTNNNGSAASRVADAATATATDQVYCADLMSSNNSGNNTTPAGLTLQVTGTSPYMNGASYLFDTLAPGAGSVGPFTAVADFGFEYAFQRYFLKPASGSGGVTGTGSSALSPFASTGSGAQTFSGSGSSTLSPFGSSGTGVAGLVGTGSSALSPFISTGTGTETVSGSGSSALSPFGSNGSGTSGTVTAGSGSSALSPFGSSGTGTAILNLVGTGSSSLSSFGCAGTGTETCSGTGSSALSPFASTGVGTVSVPLSGTGNSALSSFGCTGVGFSAGGGSFSNNWPTTTNWPTATCWPTTKSWP